MFELLVIAIIAWAYVRITRLETENDRIRQDLRIDYEIGFNHQVWARKANRDLTRRVNQLELQLSETQAARKLLRQKLIKLTKDQK